MKPGKPSVCEFNDLDAYLLGLRADPSLALLPMQDVADHRGVTRAAIVRMLDVGHLTEIKIGRRRYVRASSLIELEQQRLHEIEVVHQFLVAHAANPDNARNLRPTYYSNVMALVGLRSDIPADRGRIGGILGDISIRTWKERRVALSVLVCRANTRHTGPGFFGLLEMLDGYPKFKANEHQKVIDAEMKRVFEAYRAG